MQRTDAAASDLRQSTHIKHHQENLRAAISALSTATAATVGFLHQLQVFILVVLDRLRWKAARFSDRFVFTRIATARHRLAAAWSGIAAAGLVWLPLLRSIAMWGAISAGAVFLMDTPLLVAVRILVYTLLGVWPSQVAILIVLLLVRACICGCVCSD